MRAPYSRTLFDLLCEQADRYPSKLAVIAGDVRLTYPELEDRARMVAAGLRAAGVGRGERVGMLVDNRAEWLEILFGAAAIGATPVPFSTWSKRREIEFLLTDSKTQALFFVDRVGDQNYAGDLQDLFTGNRKPLKALVAIGQAPSRAIDYAEFVAAHEPLADAIAPGEGARPSDDAFILYTSGSTSYPKAVPLAHGDTIENGFNIGERQGYRPGDRVLLSLPLFWSYGSANAMCAAFTHGAALVLQTRFEPAQAIDLIERHACTAIYTLPAVTTAIITHPSFRPERTKSLRTGLTIGTPQDVVAAAETLGAREICNVYGQTESYGNCAVTWHHWPLERRKSVQGPPLPGVTLRISDPETGTVLPPGKIGLIEVAGYLTRGYDGVSSEQNEKSFTRDGYFRTGDLGYLTPEGDIAFAARDSEMIKRAGINIAPAEVEEILRQHPSVAAAGVAGAPDDERGEIIVAFIVAAAGAAATADELRAHCRALASSYKAPDRIEFCKALPVTNTGKLMRRELKQMAASATQRTTEASR